MEWHAWPGRRSPLAIADRKPVISLASSLICSLVIAADHSHVRTSIENHAFIRVNDVATFTAENL